ncbi:hypothetical protein NC651_006559 [Populus alba x Populus x berolinensis]|nr:hypothetical protein NC651_006559 [Populus alba x Populus x berolinensis]
MLPVPILQCHARDSTSCSLFWLELDVDMPISPTNVYFAVHSRVIPPHASIFRVSDLKGSWKGRKVNKSKVVENIMLKDMDLGFLFYLDPLIREKLLGYVNYSGSSFLSQ